MAVTDIPPPPTAYVNARLMDPATGLDAPGALYAEGESIADFGPGLFADGVPDGIEVVDCEGYILCPGLVDMRVQLREPGEEHKGTLASAGRAAAAGGITTMVCLPNTLPVIDDVSVVEFVARRARLLGLAKVYPYGAVTKGLEGKELAEMGLLAESGAVAFTDGTKPVADTATMRRALQYAATFDLLIVQHPEEPGLAGEGVVNAGAMATRLGLVGIPTQAEVMMIERDLRLLELTGGRLHFGHVTTGAAIDVIRQAKARGMQVTCDTAPFYFSLNELAVGDYRTFSKLSPPLRAEEDRLAVIEGLRDGTIDIIASDHAPEDEEAKRLPFGQAAFGGIGLETLLPISLELVRNGHLTLIEMLRLITCVPADLLGLRAGRLVRGAPADLLIFDPDKPWKIDRDDMISKSKNSPFDGHLTQGRPRRTVVDGRTVYQF
ncbi:dihydroorotase [Magnetospira thiophila]